MTQNRLEKMLGKTAIAHMHSISKSGFLRNSAKSAVLEDVADVKYNYITLPGSAFW